jgi:MoxR-like ATPase
LRLENYGCNAKEGVWMSFSEIVNPESIIQATREFDEIGRESFLTKYGFSPSKVYFLKIKGKEYDSKAILGVAHLIETGNPLRASEFSGGESTVRKLNQLGFSVTTKLPDFSKINKSHVEAAIQEFLEIGSEEFYEKYSGTPSRKYRVLYDETEIDAKPLLLAALKLVTEYADFEPNDLPGNKKNIADPLINLGFEVVEISGIRYWQVMHNKTARDAESLGVLWSPKTKDNGARNPWYDTMAEAKVGDVIYSYRNGKVHAIGVVSNNAITAPSPFPNRENNYEGWLLKVDFKTLETPFDPSEFYDQLKPVMTKADENSVRMPGGNSIMGYLKEISSGLAQKFDELAGGFVNPPPYGSKKKMKDSNTANRLNDLAEELLLDVSFLEEIEELLEDKKQVIFYGPPGAGKTYVALKLAEALGGGDEEVSLVEVVQFHPSYAYEDFVEGFRPTEDGAFKLRRGKLLSIADRAIQNPDKKFFLIIDEINRGNVAKVFGEMYFLLEYRDRDIQLQYSDEPFRMPENLYFIGTMNSADRSIGLIDSALRRRFHFVSFYPTEDVMKNLLRDWLEKNAPSVSWIATAVDNANRELGNPDFAIGPSHFMKKDLTEDLARKIWRRSIIPYVEDFFFNQKEKAKDYDLDRLRALKRAEKDFSSADLNTDVDTEAS